MKTAPEIAAVLISVAASAYCQGTLARPAFDAASLKPFTGRHYPGAAQMKGGPGTSDPGRVTWGLTDLPDLLMKAFDVPGYRIVGLPRETGRDIKTFSFTATMPPETTRQQFRLMLQNLLIERFQIRLHHETRMYAGYDLVVTPGGPKLRAPANPDAPAPLGTFGQLVKRSSHSVTLMRRMGSA